MKKVLVDWIPCDTLGFEDIILKHGRKIVDKEYNCNSKQFPQTNSKYKYISNWVKLNDGTVVGINESPKSGITIVALGANTAEKNMKKLQQSW